MPMEHNSKRNEIQCPQESFTVRLTDSMLYDRLHTLSAEYSISVEMLTNIAVKRLVGDIDFVRNLRLGKLEGG